MTSPPHTPYDGSSQPFTIGLTRLDPATWIEVDAHLADYLDEKERLNATVPDAVFAAEPGTEAAQAEVLDLLAEHLPAHFPQTYRREEGGIRIVPTGAMIDLHAGPALLTAACLVQEDLVLMRRNEAGWRLAAASLCFPSSWSLREKFGRTITDIHGPVPDFGAGSRADELINRMFDRLQPGNPVLRWNWSLQPDRARYKPSSDHSRADGHRHRFPRINTIAGTFIRVERQTLRKLPNSGDILFTIRIHVDPMQVLADHEERARLAQSFADQLSALDLAQADYKGLSADRDQLVTMLKGIATGGLL